MYCIVAIQSGEGLPVGGGGGEGGWQLRCIYVFHTLMALKPRAVKVSNLSWFLNHTDNPDTKLQRFLNLRYWSSGGET